MLAETAEFLSLLLEQTERLAQMTKTLLEMSDLQTVARTDQIQLGPMIEEIFADLAPLAEKNDITLERKGDGAMTGNDTLIYRMLFNLTENAIKYDRPGGAVRISISQEEKRLLIRITDTGCGIPKEKQANIFQRFEKLDENAQGSGLGLSICQLIIEHIGGRIWIDPDYTEGSRFMFTHPINQIRSKQKKEGRS